MLVRQFLGRERVELWPALSTWFIRLFVIGGSIPSGNLTQLRKRPVKVKKNQLQMVVFHSYVNDYQRVHHTLKLTWNCLWPQVIWPPHWWIITFIIKTILGRPPFSDKAWQSMTKHDKTWQSNKLFFSPLVSIVSPFYMTGFSSNFWSVTWVNKHSYHQSFHASVHWFLFNID